jgi:Uma2 family endonuclease
LVIISDLAYGWPTFFFTALAGSACSRCELFYELDWIVDDLSVVRPDLLISCGDKVTEYMERAPVLIVEILSDSSRAKDRTAKFDLYQQQGVKYYLMADPDEKSLEVYQLSGNKYQRLADSQQYEFQLSESCAIEVNFEGTRK